MPSEMTAPAQAVLPAKGASASASQLDLSSVFSETPLQTMKRWLLGILFELKPSNIRAAPAFVCYTALDWLRGGTEVPDAPIASFPDGFAGVCRNLRPETVLAAARRGYFHYRHCGPQKWWTRSERSVLLFKEAHLPKRLRRQIRADGYTVTFDTAFEQVIANCARPRAYNWHSLTWITPDVIRLYTELYRQGHVHSFEVWSPDGRLVGGGYGIASGCSFTTESQFSLEPNTSKIGFAVLNYHLHRWGFVLNDGKDTTPTTAALGFRLIPRAEFEALLQDYASKEPSCGSGKRWQIEASMEEVSKWAPAGAP